MSHNIIIILDRTDQLKGNATSGDFSAIRQAAVDADSAIHNGAPNSAKLEEALEALEDWLGECVTGAGEHLENLST